MATTSTASTSRSPGTRGPRMSAEERRDAIVAAATEEFATGGLVGASTEAIARRVGVSQPYVFQLFGTKKELFLAVVRQCFQRMRLGFERAAREDLADLPPGHDTILDVIGAEYMRLLADRTSLLVQLQAYAACDDPEVRAAVRDEYARLYRFVASASGAPNWALRAFFAEGMMMNVAAAMDLESVNEDWAANCAADGEDGWWEHLS